MSTDKLYKTDGFRFTPLKCFDSFRHSHVCALGLVGLAALFDGLFQDDVLDLSKTLVQISTNSSKMTLFGRRVVTINLVERWLIHPNPGPVMSPLCQLSHHFLHLFPDYLRSDMLRFPVGKIIIYHLIFDVKSFNLLSFSELFYVLSSVSLITWQCGYPILLFHAILSSTSASFTKQTCIFVSVLTNGNGFLVNLHVSFSSLKRFWNATTACVTSSSSSLSSSCQSFLQKHVLKNRLSSLVSNT